mmetsp:Transcript_10624/g.39024  ORF Transcript_10624/g.39024 Transcript_10624/m.39024 type:complete len:445 (+) Transcript_10624:168-1502(+)
MIRQQSLRLQRQSSLRLPSSRREERAVGEADVDPLALHVDTPRREEPLGWQWRTLFYRARSWLGEAQSQLLDGVRAAAASVSLGGRWPCGVSFTLGGCLAGVVLAGLLMRSFLDNAASVHEPVGLLTSSAQPRSARQHTPPSAVACAALRELQVCSHQVSVEVDLVRKRKLIQSTPGDASDVLLTLVALWEEGVNCFDLDVLVTREGELVVGHPRHLPATLEGESHHMHDFSVAELQRHSKGIQFPHLDHVLALLASLVKTEAMIPEPFKMHQPNQSSSKLFLEVKQQAQLDERVIVRLADMILKHEAQGLVVLWLIGGQARTENLERLRSRYPWLQCIKGFRDHEVDAEGAKVPLFYRAEDLDARAFDFLGPSVHLPIKVRKAMDAQSPGHVVSWVVDNDTTLLRAVEGRAAAVISNRPLHLMQSVREIVGLCEEMRGSPNLV